MQKKSVEFSVSYEQQVKQKCSGSYRRHSLSQIASKFSRAYSKRVYVGISTDSSTEMESSV